MSYHVLHCKSHVVAATTCIGDGWAVRCDALDFLKEMSANRQYSGSCKGFLALFNLYAEQGRTRLTTEMFHEANKQEGIWEFIKGDLRLLCFVDGNTVFLTNGYIKNGRKADPSEVAKAVRAKQAYENNKGKR